MKGVPEKLYLVSDLTYICNKKKLFSNCNLSAQIEQMQDNVLLIDVRITNITWSDVDVNEHDR